MEASPNARLIEAWNTVLFDKFSRHRDAAASAFAGHGDSAIDRLSFVPGLRVVDIGCGFGDTTRELGRRVGTRGLALGVDAAPRFLEVAQREAADMQQVRYRVADVQSESIAADRPFDIAFSRMGTMFFADPVVALTNVARSLGPDGVLSMVVWRRREANVCFDLPARVARAVLEVDLPPASGPGPFSMSDPDLVSDQLVAAGFCEVAFRRNDADARLGGTIAEAIAFALTFGPAGELVRLAGPAAEARRPELEAALGDALHPYMSARGAVMPSSTWHITARRGQT